MSLPLKQSSIGIFYSIASRFNGKELQKFFVKIVAHNAIRKGKSKVMIGALDNSITTGTKFAKKNVVGKYPLS